MQIDTSCSIDFTLTNGINVLIQKTIERDEAECDGDTERERWQVQIRIGKERRDKMTNWGATMSQFPCSSHIHKKWSAWNCRVCKLKLNFSVFVVSDSLKMCALCMCIARGFLHRCRHSLTLWVLRDEAMSKLVHVMRLEWVEFLRIRNVPRQ